MTSRLTSMQAQFRQKQQDDKEHKLFTQGQGIRKPGGSGSSGLASHRNGFLPSIQNKTAPQPLNSRSGTGLRNSAPRQVPSALRPASSASPTATPFSASRAVPVVAAVATKPKTILHKITLTGTSSTNNSSSKNGSASPLPRVGLDRSATYSKPSIGVGNNSTFTSTDSSQNRSQSQTRPRPRTTGRMDENGNELMTGTVTATAAMRTSQFGVGGSKPSTSTARVPGTADLTKRFAGLNLGERKAPAPVSSSRNASAPLSSRSASTTRPPSATAAARKTTPPARASEPARPRAPVSSSSSAAVSTRPVSVSSRQRQPLTKKATPPPGSVSCSQCSRYFASDRIEKHETICKKTAAKKRKVFDPTKMRMKGTEAEPYLKVVVASTRAGAAGARGKAGGTAAAPAAKSNWRKKHEDFIRTIRLAKEYNAHVAAGGNPADLPPPPPSDYSDYVQCPHCGRKFSEGAASRHIPKCSSIKSNKR